jgi:Na+/phosphate symporter
MSDTTPYHTLTEVVARLRNGQATPEQAETILNMLDGDLQSWATQLSEIPLPDQERDASQNMIEASMHGLQLIADATQQVREYMNDRDEARADKALETAREGMELIWRVKGMTEENMERLMQEMEEAKIDGLDAVDIPLTDNA